MKFIELKNVNKTYKNGITAIADLSVGVARWDFVFVILFMFSRNGKIVIMVTHDLELASRCDEEIKL